MPIKTKQDIYEIFKAIQGEELDIDVDKKTDILDVLNAYCIKAGIYNPKSSSPKIKKGAKFIQEALDDIVTSKKVLETKEEAINTVLNDFILGKDMPKVLTVGAGSSLTGVITPNNPFGVSSRNPKILYYTEPLEAAPAAFKGNTNVEEIWLPYATYVANNIVEGCTNLKLLDLGHAATSYLATQKLSNCPNLEILFIRNNENSAGVASIDANTFVGTKFDPNQEEEEEGGIVYVPRKFLSQYQNSSAWETNARVKEFRAIEDSPYSNPDGGYVEFDYHEGEYPAQTLTGTSPDGNISVKIIADEGALPSMSSLSLKNIDLKNEGSLYGIDIGFKDRMGNEVAPLVEMIFTISYSGETSSHDELSLRYIDQAGLAKPVESDKIVEITNKSVTFASDLPGTYIVYDPDGGGQR